MPRKKKAPEMKLPQDIVYVGVNDHQVDLFEGQYVVPNGMSYNSYIVFDKKIAVFDTVDQHFTDEWLGNIEKALGDKLPNYLVVQHMEPDHSANVYNFAKKYPRAKIVASEKAFEMMQQFFGTNFEKRQVVINDGDSLSLGKHKFTFVTAPMVHWPEVIMSYDETTKTVFSADAFGKFGALDVEEPGDDEARRYYIGIVGKYGEMVQNLFRKISALEIETILPLHGPILTENLGHYLSLYTTWATYGVEKRGIVIAYTSVYGNTKKAALLLADKLKENNCPEVVVYDLARDDMSKAVADAFSYGRLVLATTTYNAELYPFMRRYVEILAEHEFQNRTVAIIENGTWSPQVITLIKEALAPCKNITYARNNVKITSALDEKSLEKIDKLAAELCMDYIQQKDETANKEDLTALFDIGYGLYVVTSNDGKRDNGIIVNTVTQLTDTPNRVAVNINKRNYSHDVIKKTGKLNVNCLSVEAPFSIFQNFGFQSGRDVDKFAGMEVLHSDNGLAYLPQYINAMMSLEVEQYIDFDTHGMFVCTVSEARVFSKKETMTYTYYQKNVKPKPPTEGVTGWVCNVCGYIYEGDDLPDDFICPLCKHGKQDFFYVNNG